MSNRKSIYRINSLILDRWSPRAMDGSKITNNELMTLLEAGRYAPSAYNGQPWKFLYSFKDDENWKLFFEPLVDFNKLWVVNASALILIVSDKYLNGKLSNTNQFDAGAAAQNIALQASYMGLVCHAMSGFDFKKVRQNLNIPDTYDILAMLAIGKTSNKDILDPELKDKEVISQRKELSDISKEGKFK